MYRVCCAVWCGAVLVLCGAVFSVLKHYGACALGA